MNLDEIEQALEAVGDELRWETGDEGVINTEWSRQRYTPEGYPYDDREYLGNLWPPAAKLAVLLRNSAPELIAEVRRLRAAVEAVEKLADMNEEYGDLHHGHSPMMGNPDCGACWVNDIRHDLAEHLGTGSES